jgi:hypothetical protein
MVRISAAGQQEEGLTVSIVALWCFRHVLRFSKADCAVSYDITVT